ncbi:MAG: N-acetylmuramoyl-L-alanine amidase [Defluviimonas sp.]|uniref:N-acetylmuramoyl-L-alanine amidase n=1 Tax=Albidovulum sp. TaxID=1872424 RepID=UPI001DC763C3|nr:N-acetylmuramoyl-L-alanine amidase [Paracoccaceae bacterium]MCC0064237.1 N-acetylmuramoyl-L-alanine amidase [Defluviimonas sp.]
MRWPWRIVGILAVALAAGLASRAPRAEEMTALARLLPSQSRLADAGGGIEIDLALSQGVPYRAFLLDAPPRLVLDFSEVSFGHDRPEALNGSEAVRALSWGVVRPGWSRLVAELDGPYRIASAEERVQGAAGAAIRLKLLPEEAGRFAERARAGPPPAARWTLPRAAVPSEAPMRRQTGDRPLVVVLDPGHGGIDPGAETATEKEADVVLAFARDLSETLRRAGMTVVLTRDGDTFVPLETRISVARAARADVFLSIHADSLAEGEATGATVYKLAATASDSASAKLAERHDRGDLLAGVDLSGQDDTVAAVLMDLARSETEPRADRLAATIAAELKRAGIKMHRHPIQEAGFSVLKSPDIPSLLLEIGFLSSEEDRARFADPVWRSVMQGAILTALQGWAVADAAEARLIRQ